MTIKLKVHPKCHVSKGTCPELFQDSYTQHLQTVDIDFAKMGGCLLKVLGRLGMHLQETRRKQKRGR